MGRWKSHISRNEDALDSSRWEELTFTSKPLFEPLGHGGLGVAVAPKLLEAGIQQLGNFLDSHGALMGFDAAMGVHSGLKEAHRAEWEIVRSSLK